MTTNTPRRSLRIAHTHTPKMSERKKSLFQSNVASQPESLTKHRRLPVVESESDSDEYDLGIISTLDTSSSDELHDQEAMSTPVKTWGHQLRSYKKNIIDETQGVKNFMKSPFTLHKYKTTYSGPDAKSTPATPHLQHQPLTPSSTRSCGSAQTSSSTSSRARKSLASLIADAESCSSSLKDLNFDTDSGTDSKENSPNKRRTTRIQRTPKLATFKGVLVEQKKNESPYPVVCLTKMDVSPTKMLKTPDNSTEGINTPPKLVHRKSVLEIMESPDSNDSSSKFKRLRNESLSNDNGPNSKYPRLDTSVPKARHSLFNTDKLKEILSAKSFYGKVSNNQCISMEKRLENAVKIATSDKKHSLSYNSNKRKTRKPGQINLGVKHKIRKPKLNKNRIIRINQPLVKKSDVKENSNINISNNMSIGSLNSSQELENEKADPFDKEKQTIDALLSQWTEDEVPESEQIKSAPELPCFNQKIIEETKQIFEPVSAVPVTDSSQLPQSGVILELGTNSGPVVSNEADVTMAEGHKADHGDAPQGTFLPVEGGYILVEDGPAGDQEDLPDLDEIERELRMLDEQILKVASSNHINVGAVIASTEKDADLLAAVPSPTRNQETDEPKLFPIFNNPNPGTNTPTVKVQEKSKKIIKTSSNQYIIDAGQKKIGLMQCKECGVIYHIGDAQDEHDHLVYHNATDVLRFNGWKDETVVGRWGEARCIRIRAGTPGWKKVSSLLERVVHPQLGYAVQLPRGDSLQYTAYLHVEKRQITGCLVIEVRNDAHKLIPGDPDCCSVEHYPVKCGISRLWVHCNHRRSGIATRLVDCARASFLYGQVIKKDEIAFSTPTANGKGFATNYCGTEQFYVYIY